MALASTPRDVTFILDNGYFTEDKLVADDGTERFVTSEIKINVNDQLRFSANDLLYRGHSDELSPFVTVAVLRQGSSIEDYVDNSSAHAQNIEFMYGEHGEVYWLPLPYECPARMSFVQLQEAVTRHFPECSTQKVIFRRQGGFGAGGDSSVIDTLSRLLLEAVTSHYVEAVLVLLLAKARRLLPRTWRRRRQQRYAQIARDLIARRMSSFHAIDQWLKLSSHLTTGEVMTALAVPRKLAVRVLLKTGHRRAGISQTWIRADDNKSIQRRQDWIAKAGEGYNWSPLE